MRQIVSECYKILDIFVAAIINEHTQTHSPPNRWPGTQKLSGVNRSAQTRQVHINAHAHTYIHHRIQLAVGNMTMIG